MTPRRRHPGPEDVRTHLLDAALRAFARRGYERTTVKDIAAEAQVASGLLYHYFPSKQALLQALFGRSGGMVMQAFSHVASIADPRERFAELLNVSARVVRENLEFWRVSYGVRFQHAVLDDRAVGIAAQSTIFVELFTALFTEMGRPQPELEARVVFATMDGLFQHFVLAPDTYPLDAVLERLIQQHGGSSAQENP